MDERRHHIFKNVTDDKERTAEEAEQLERVRSFRLRLEQTHASSYENFDTIEEERGLPFLIHRRLSIWLRAHKDQRTVPLPEPAHDPATETSRPPADGELVRAIELAESGQFMEAEDLIKGRLRAGRDAQSLAVLGTLRLHTKKFEAAAEILSEALEKAVGPLRGPVAINLSVALRNAASASEALRVAEAELDLPAERDDETQGLLLLAKGSALRELGDHAPGISALASAIVHLEAASRNDTVADTLIELAENARASHDHEAAIRYARRAISFAKASGRDSLHARALNVVGRAFFDLAQLVPASAVLQTALRLVGPTDAHRGVRRLILENYGGVQNNLNHLNDARELFNEAMLLALEAGDIVGMAHNEANLGAVELKDNNLPSAREHFERAAKMHASRGREQDLAMDEIYLAEIECLEGNRSESRTLLENAIVCLKGSPERRLVLWGLMRANRIYYRLGDMTHACDCLREAYAIAGVKEAGYQKRIWDLAREQGCVMPG